MAKKDDEDDYVNGKGTSCPLHESWSEYRLSSLESMREISDMHNTIEHFNSYGECLPKIAEGVETMAKRLEEMNKTVLAAALGKDHMPIATVDALFKQHSKNNATLYRAFAAITLGLLGVIVYLLIGEHFDWIRNLH